ncbi:hypothetical protein WG66_016807 [Moniliophthora roreri]|nr:hypothetical protein WG66_016807 [Moniliophthora roreri]
MPFDVIIRRLNGSMRSRFGPPLANQTWFILIATSFKYSSCSASNKKSSYSKSPPNSPIASHLASLRII